jgi:hypothetical protein
LGSHSACGHLLVLAAIEHSVLIRNGRRQPILHNGSGIRARTSLGGVGSSTIAVEGTVFSIAIAPLTRRPVGASRLRRKTLDATQSTIVEIIELGPRSQSCRAGGPVSTDHERTSIVGAKPWPNLFMPPAAPLAGKLIQNGWSTVAALPPRSCGDPAIFLCTTTRDRRYPKISNQNSLNIAEI